MCVSVVSEEREFRRGVIGGKYDGDRNWRSWIRHSEVVVPSMVMNPFES